MYIVEAVEVNNGQFNMSEVGYFNSEVKANLNILQNRNNFAQSGKFQYAALISVKEDIILHKNTVNESDIFIYKYNDKYCTYEYINPCSKEWKYNEEMYSKLLLALIHLYTN